MSILTTLLNQKTHIIYAVIIVIIASVGYHFFKKDPVKIVTTVTKVETKVQTVQKIVNKDRIVYVNRTIKTIDKKANGEIVTTIETDKGHSDTKTNSNTSSRTQTDTTITAKTVETFMKNYTVDALFPINPFNPALPNPLDTQVLLGVRIFDLPAYMVVGTTVRLNTALIGIRLEF